MDVNANVKKKSSIKKKSKITKVFAYLARYIVGFFVGAAVLVFVFTLFSRISNVYIMISDGLKVRTAAIMQQESDDLVEFFTQEFLESDLQLFNNPYQDFVITSYNYNIKIEKINVMPWSKSAKIIFSENLSQIKGEINELAKQSYLDENKPLAPPAWENSQYEATLKYDETQSRWYIAKLVTIKKIDKAPTKTQPTKLTTQPPIS